MAVYGAVAEGVDHPCFAEHGLPSRLFETGVVDQGGKVVLVREPEESVMLVGPAYRQFQRSAGIEAGRPRIAVHCRFRLRCGLEHSGPFALKEGELAHGAADGPSLNNAM